MYFYSQGNVPLLFCENDTNHTRLDQLPDATPYVNDGINNYLVHNQQEAVNPDQVGTKVSSHYKLTVPGGGLETVCLRLSQLAPAQLAKPFESFEAVVAKRKEDADAFYDSMMTPGLRANADLQNIFVKEWQECSGQSNISTTILVAG